MEDIQIALPSELHSLIEATALANGIRAEEVLRAAIRDFLEDKREQRGEWHF